LMMHGFGVNAIKLNSKQTTLDDDFSALLNPLSKFDPQGPANAVEGEKVKSITVKNDSGQFIVAY
jgi:alpha-glucosidase